MSKPMPNEPMMMDANAAAADPCPDREFVSCFYDGELASETGEARHIGGCPRCGQTLKAYAEIGCGLQREMSAAVPPDLAARVSWHVRRRIDEEEVPPRRSSFVWWGRAAAAAAMVILAGLAFRGLFEERRRLEVAARPDAATKSQSVVPEQIASIDEPVRPRAATPLTAPGDIAAADFAPASLGPVPPIRFVTGGGESSPAAIAPAVRHVWLSDNPTACCAKFAAMATAAGVSPEQIVPSADDAVPRQVVVNASRRQVVGMVHAWAASGHRLLSPAQPQPEQAVFSGSGDEPVQYAAVFVPAGE
jgi:hypothetical protein